MTDIKWRKYEPLPPSTKPLIYGWQPSKKKMDLVCEGRGNELPGAWLYDLSGKVYLHGHYKLSRLLNYLFAVFYADKKV